jgi:glycosyltransferase involved in cell wall biosynthesis
MLNKNSNYTLVMICLNEIDGIKHISDDVNKHLHLLNDIIFIDGGSTDGSIEMAKKNGWSVFLQDKNNMGVLNGIKLGLDKCKTDYVIFFSPDNNCKPEAIPALISETDKGNDLVIASRYKDGAKSFDDTLVSGFGNYMITKMVNILFNSNYTDVLNLYKCIRVEVLKEMNHDIFEKISGLSTGLCIKCAINKKKVSEVGFDEPLRLGGVSKRPIIEHGYIEISTIIIEFIKNIFKKS